jgi:hypothetical protein
MRLPASEGFYGLVNLAMWEEKSEGGMPSLFYGIHEY